MRCKSFPAKQIVSVLKQVELGMVICGTLWQLNISDCQLLPSTKDGGESAA